MDHAAAYQTDLAYIHDVGYGGFAAGSAPGLIHELHAAGIDAGLVVDLGCGSGIWARYLVDAGYDVAGVDLSPAMIELARQRVPQAQFQVGSFVEATLPPCRAITALGEVFNYLFDERVSLDTVQTVVQRVYDALAPGGLLIFDVATLDRHRSRKQAFTEGDDWACLVEYHRDEAQRRLSRRIVTFRRIGGMYRRHEETHVQQLFDPAEILTCLQHAGFAARTSPSYGSYPLGEGVLGFIAAKGT